LTSLTYLSLNWIQQSGNRSRYQDIRKPGKTCAILLHPVAGADKIVTSLYKQACDPKAPTLTTAPVHQANNYCL